MYPESTPILDFTVIDSHNITTLSIADTSFYPPQFNIDNPILEITPPAFSPILTPFIPNSITTLNSNNLNLTCGVDASSLAELPDGIWTVTQTISPPIPFNKHKTFLRTDIIQLKFGKAFMKNDIIQCDLNVRYEHEKVLNQIWIYIMSAIAAANQCNNTLAMQLYRMGDKMLNNFVRDKCSTQFTGIC